MFRSISNGAQLIQFLSLTLWGPVDSELMGADNFVIYFPVSIIYFK